MKSTYAVDEKGQVIGQGHHRAKLSDEDVEAIRFAYDPTGERGHYARGRIPMSKLASMFGVSKQTIQMIVQFYRRAHTPVAHRPCRRPMPQSKFRSLGLSTYEEDIN